MTSKIVSATIRGCRRGGDEDEGYSEEEFHGAYARRLSWAYDDPIPAFKAADPVLIDCLFVFPLQRFDKNEAASS